MQSSIVITYTDCKPVSLAKVIPITDFNQFMLYLPEVTDLHQTWHAARHHEGKQIHRFDQLLYKTLPSQMFHEYHLKYKFKIQHQFVSQMYLEYVYFCQRNFRIKKTLYFQLSG